MQAQRRRWRGSDRKLAMAWVNPLDCVSWVSATVVASPAVISVRPAWAIVGSLSAAAAASASGCVSPKSSWR